MNMLIWRRSQWPRGLRRWSAAACLLRSWVRIPTGAWMFVCECCVLSGRGLFEELFTRPEMSYRLWCVVVCDLETSRMKRPWPALGRSATKKKANMAERKRSMTSLNTLHYCIVRGQMYVIRAVIQQPTAATWTLWLIKRFGSTLLWSCLFAGPCQWFLALIADCLVQLTQFPVN